jgi:hypothetical protein
MAAVDLTDEERHALIGLLTTEIEASRYPLSPRIVLLKGIRAKLGGEEMAPPSPPHRSRRPARPRR